MVKTVPLKLQVLLKGSVFCICRNTPKPTGFLGWGGRRKESNLVELDEALGPVLQCYKETLIKGLKGCMNSCFQKKKSQRRTYRFLRHGDILKSSFLKYSIMQKLFLYPCYFSLVSGILSPLVRLSKQCQGFL